MKKKLRAAISFKREVLGLEKICLNKEENKVAEPTVGHRDSKLIYER